MYNVSFYRNSVDVIGVQTDAETVLRTFNTQKYYERIIKIRNEKDKKIRDNYKKQLPAVAFSGLFAQRRTDKLIIHSGILCIDIDTEKDTNNFYLMFSKLYPNSIYSYFTSPSGVGVKILYRINPLKHIDSFMAIDNHFIVNGISIDPSGKDVSRLCFVSYSELYINHNATELPINDIICSTPIFKL